MYVDLSSWQAGFDFQRAATVDGVEGAIVKRTGGTGYKNPYFRNQIAGAQAAGMEVAAYHYMGEPTGNPGSPEAEADALCDALADMVMPVALDVEEKTPGYPDQNDWIKRFVQRTIYRGKPTRIMYTGNYWVQQERLYDAELGKLALWLASWQDSVPPVPAGAAWERIWLWQTESRARCGGMFPIDTNQLMQGGRAEFRALAYADTPTPQQLIKASIVPPVFAEPMTTGHELHPFFWAAWDLTTHGYPLGPGCLYDDGKIRQLFERVCLGSNGRQEPVANEGLGQAYVLRTGANIVDFADVHPLIG